jgi:hypothetical protein
MFEKLFVKTSDLVFHTIAPYSVERERFLEHCCEEGFSKAALRRIAGIVRGTCAQAFCGQRPGTWRTHFSGRTHFHGTQAPPPTSESSASNIFRHSGMTLAFKTTFEVFTRVSPDNSLERLTERSVGLVTDRPSDVYELLVTLL